MKLFQLKQTNLNPPKKAGCQGYDQNNTHVNKVSPFSFNICTLSRSEQIQMTIIMR